MSRCVEEGEFLPIRQGDMVGADVLGNATRLAGDDVGLADVVEQRRLAVIDVAHDGDNWRPRYLLLVDFFGRQAATTPVVAWLAVKSGAALVPVFPLPLADGRYRLIYETPIDPSPYVSYRGSDARSLPKHSHTAASDPG